MHPLVAAAVIVLSSIVASFLVLWAVRQVVSHQSLTPHNDVSGFVYAAIGVIYAVLVGFAVITVWEDYRDAEENSVREANAAADLYRLAAGLPDPVRLDIQETVLAYAQSAIDEEWPAMADGTAPSAQTAAHIDHLWQSLTAAQPSAPAEIVVFDGSLTRLVELSEFRRQRLLDTGRGLLGVMWSVIIGGAILTVLFPCVFGVENALLHSLIVATLAATLGLLLFLTYDLNHPFEGDVRVQPEALTRVVEQFTTERSAILAPTITMRFTPLAAN